MNDHQTPKRPINEEGREIETGPDPPRIYVASLSDYNAGRLHGVWLDATANLEEMSAAVQELLADSPEPWAEETAIHDYEGFGAWRLSEYEQLDTVHAVANAIEEHGPALTHWLAYLDHPARAIETFDDAYLGKWESLRAYTEELVDDLGVTIKVEPESWSTYVRFDTDSLARDLSFELHTSDDADGAIHIFQPSAADEIHTGVVNSTHAQMHDP